MTFVTRRGMFALAAASAAALTVKSALAAPAKVPSIWEGEKMYTSMLKDGTGFATPGPKGRKVAHVFFDPQCPDCIRLMERLEPLKDKVEVIYYPIAYLNRHSEPQSATMLMAKDPYAVLVEHHENFRNPDFRGIRYDVSKLDDKIRDKVWINTKLHRRCGCRAVPYGVFKNSKGEYLPFDENLLTDELANLFEI